MIFAPSFHCPALPAESTARMRQKYVLLGSTRVGESDVPIVGSVQQTFDPGAKSGDEVTSTS